MIPLDKRLIDITVADLIQIFDGRYARPENMFGLPASIQHTQTEKMDVKACAELTGYVPEYIRQLVFKKVIPFYKTRRKLHFKRSEILQWMYKRKVAPVNEAADLHISQNSINFNK